MDSYEDKVNKIAILNNIFRLTSTPPYDVLALDCFFVMQQVCIRCHRPRDSDTLGLSQIQVLGTSPYSPAREKYLDFTKSEQPPM